MNSLNQSISRGYEMKSQRLPSLRKMTFGKSVSSSVPEARRSSIASTAALENAVAITNNNVSEGYYSPRSSFASVSSEESAPSHVVRQTFTRSPITVLQNRPKKTATSSYAFNPSSVSAAPRLMRTAKALRNLRPAIPTMVSSLAPSVVGPRLPPISVSAAAPTKTTRRNPLRNPFRNAPANRNNGVFAMQNNPMHKKQTQKRRLQTRKS
jgi:hypothetical protein